MRLEIEYLQAVGLRISRMGTWWRQMFKYRISAWIATLPAEMCFSSMFLVVVGPIVPVMPLKTHLRTWEYPEMMIRGAMPQAWM